MQSDIIDTGMGVGFATIIIVLVIGMAWVINRVFRKTFGQQNRVDETLDRGVEQQARYEALISKDEEQQRRMESLIAKWEGLTHRVEELLNCFESKKPD